MSTKRIPWFRCYPSKLLGALAQMKSDEKLVYQIVLLRIYEVWGPCPDSLDALSVRCGVNRRRVSDALDPLFQAGKLTRVDGGIMNPFAVEVMVEMMAFREERQRAGKNGALAREEKKTEKQRPALSKANVELLAKSSDSESEVDKELFPYGKSPSTGGWPADYREQFWSHYPRKTEKKAALAKLDAIRKSGTVEWSRLLAGLLRHEQHVAATRTEERYIKHPTTWLNRGCWDDEYGPGGGGGGQPMPRPTRSGFAALSAALNFSEGER